jgi:hypothetical protein
VPFLAWIGRLPGDFHVGTGKTRVAFPLASRLILSVALTVILRLARALFLR